MVTKQDEWKYLIATIGSMIDSRHKTLEINLKGYIDSAIKESEARIRRDMATKSDIKDMATKSDIKDMATKSDIKDMATKSDIKRLEKKLDEKNQRDERRLQHIEEDLLLLHAGKN
ncbi:MAG: hypothetical protein AAB553_05760 [Patescibacteria group bacterium]